MEAEYMSLSDASTLARIHLYSDLMSLLNLRYFTATVHQLSPTISRHHIKGQSISTLGVIIFEIFLKKEKFILITFLLKKIRQMYRRKRSVQIYYRCVLGMRLRPLYRQ